MRKQDGNLQVENVWAQLTMVNAIQCKSHLERSEQKSSENRPPKSGHSKAKYTLRGFWAIFGHHVRQLHGQLVEPVATTVSSRCFVRAHIITKQYQATCRSVSQSCRRHFQVRGMPSLVCSSVISPSAIKIHATSPSPSNPRNLFRCLQLKSPIKMEMVDMDVVCLFQKNDKASYNIAKNSISERT